MGAIEQARSSIVLVDVMHQIKMHRVNMEVDLLALCFILIEENCVNLLNPSFKCYCICPQDA